MSLKSLEQGKLLGFLKWIDKELASTNRKNRKLHPLTTKLRGAFAYVLACVRKRTFSLNLQIALACACRKQRFRIKNKLIKRAANCCSYTPTKLFMIQKGT